MKNNVLKLSSIVALMFMALSMYAQDAPVADIKVGPWVTNVGADAFNVLWTSNHRTLSYVEVAPDDAVISMRAKDQDSIRLFQEEELSTLFMMCGLLDSNQA